VARRRSEAPPATVEINRAPVLTLWAATVAERLGFTRDEALTLGRAVAGLNACSKGKALGNFKPCPRGLAAQRKALRPEETIEVELLGRAVPTVQTVDGIRALAREKPIDPASVDRYLQSKFGDSLEAVRRAMSGLTRALEPDDLAARAIDLYTAFRPAVPAGQKGWGAKGVLRLDSIRRLA
jgi:hypothetical protein